MYLRGSFSPPGDKSVSHRIVLFSLLARGSCSVRNLSPGADVGSSLAAVQRLGVTVPASAESVEIAGPAEIPRSAVSVDCGNSGTTMRLLMGILAGTAGEFILDGDESLRARPMERVATPLRDMGAVIQTRDGTSPVHITGRNLTGIRYRLPVPSAQIKSAVLLAGIQADGETVVEEPIPSRDHTERLLAQMGAHIRRDSSSIAVQRSDLTIPAEFHVPGDPSSAAFFLCSAVFMEGSDVSAENVLLNPGRIGFIRVLERMGAEITVQPFTNAHEPVGSVRAKFSPNLIGCTVEEQEMPSLIDEVPILALVATQCTGRTRFNGIRELRIKETDRIAAIVNQLGSMGARIDADENSLTIEGPTPLHAADPLDSYGDHRIAMMLRLACRFAGAESEIIGEESMGISYPGFTNTLETLAS